MRAMRQAFGRSVLHERIAKRFHAMLEAGLVAELED
jgi:tRNA A37 N6-isopentenylltransferase MiaA